MALTRNRPGKERSIMGIRSLTREDLGRLHEKRDTANRIQALRDPHHRLARLIAGGLSIKQAADHAGYSYNGAHRLSHDPAFMQLVAEYRALAVAEWKEEQDEFNALAMSNMRKMERQVAEHLEKADEEGELIPLRTLGTLVADRMDRFGYGKKNTTVNVNLDFAAQLERRIKRSNAVIEHQPVASPLPVGGEQLTRTESLPVPAPAAPQPFRRRA